MPEETKSEEKKKQDPGTEYLESKDLDMKIDFTKLPVIGKHLGEDTNLKFEKVYKVVDEKDSNFIDTVISAKLTILKYPIPLEAVRKVKKTKQEKVEPFTEIHNFDSGELELSDDGFSLVEANDGDIIENTTEESEEDYTKDSNKDEVISDVYWTPVKKILSVLEFSKIGLQIGTKSINIYIDASLLVKVIKFSVINFRIEIPYSTGKPSVHFDGFNVILETKELSVTGGLYKSIYEDENEEDEKKKKKYRFDGALMLKAPSFLAQIMASYTKVKNKNSKIDEYSLFAYILSKWDAKAAPPIMINGFAIGFGANRFMKLPTVDKIYEFPLIAALIADNSSAGKLEEDDGPQEALQKMQEYIEPMQGEYFIVIGASVLIVDFFNCFLLASVAFGKKLQIALMGDVTMTLPPSSPGKKTGKPIAVAEFQICESVCPSDGNITIYGALTPGSYVLERNIRLTGGFAICQWFKGEHAGDFMISLGGCHYPGFVNDHYPKIPPIGWNANISGATFKGQYYFAITSSMMMMGGDMELSYKVGWFTFWAKGGFHAWIQWKPVHYDLTMYVSLGASLHVKVWFVHVTLSFEVGAHLHIWGPKFGGEIWVKLWKWKVGTDFGAKNAWAPAINAEEFAETYLPENEQGHPQPQSIQIVDGLLPVKCDKCSSVVNAEHLVLSIQSKIPFQKYKIQDQSEKTEYDGKLGVVPMYIKELNSAISVTINKVNKDKTKEMVPNEHLKVEVIKGNVPSALWKSERPGINDGAMQGVPIGVSVKPVIEEPSVILPSPTESYQIAELLKNESITHDMSWKNYALPEDKVMDKENAMNTIKNTIKKLEQRQDMIHAFRKIGMSGQVKILDMANYPKGYFRANPEIKTTGSM